MPTQVIPLEGIDTVGMVKDIPPIKLPPGAWTEALNVRFDDGAIRKMKGFQPIFDEHGLDNIRHINYWENPNVRCYVVINREGTEDVAYLLTLDGQEATVDEKGRYANSDNWTSTQYNGGYSIIINNGIDRPQHITVQLGGSASIASLPDFADLPGWDSYISGSVAADELYVSADILISYGNLLVAGGLTERSTPVISQTFTGAAIVQLETLTIDLTFNSTPSIVAGDIIEIRGDPDYTFTWDIAGDGTLQDEDTPTSVTVSSPYNGTWNFTSVTNGVYRFQKVGDTVAGRRFTPTDLVVNEDPDDPANTGIVLAAGATTTYPDGTAYPEGVFNSSFTLDTDLYTPLFSNSGDITIYRSSNQNTGDYPREVVRDLRGVVRTSSVAAPGAIPANWNPFENGAGTADEINLADAGKITAVKELRGNLFVFTSDTITQLRVSGTGLTAVPITKEYGAVAQDAVFGFQGTLLIVGSDDIYIFAGNPGDIKSIADGRVRKYFYEDTMYGVDATYFRQMKMIRNQLFDEIWLCYPTIGSVGNLLDRALVWNYKSNTWTQRELNNTRSLTTGPIPGGAITGDEYVATPTSAEFGYVITIQSDDNRTIELDSGTIFSTVPALVEAMRLAITGQTGFNAYINVDGNLVVVDTPPGITPWTITIVVDGVELSPVLFSGGTDPERPWPSALLNEARNFPIFAGNGVIQAGEVGYNMEVSGVERTHLQFAPTSNTERLRGVYLNAEGNTTFDIDIATRKTPGGQATPAENHEFSVADDWKTDFHTTSRLIDIDISDNSAEAWAIAGISLEIGGGGTR